MGIRLVGQALSADWSVVSDRARLILIQMCYVARDKSTSEQAACLYFGGHKALIINILGKDPDALSESNRNTCEIAIKRAIRELKKAGAISLVYSGDRRHTAVYELHPGNFPGLTQDPLPVDNSETPPTKGVHIDPPLGVHLDPPFTAERGTQAYRKGVHLDPPRGEHRGEQEDHLEVDQPTQPSTELSAGAR